MPNKFSYMATLAGKIVYKCDAWLKRVLDAVRARYQRPFRRFGLVEALVFSRQVDFWLRASRVMTQLCGERVLDVGSGSLGLQGALRMAGMGARYRVVPTDINRAFLTRGIVSSAAYLPFKSKSFDAVVAMDLLEHVPSELRAGMVSEMCRVARRRVIVTLPIRSPGGQYDGLSADVAFQQWHVAALGYGEGNTAEHLSVAYPVYEEIVKLRPSRVEPICGNRFWLPYMKLSHTPVGWIAAGLAYWLRWARLERRPPFHSCLMVWDLE